VVNWEKQLVKHGWTVEDVEAVRGGDAWVVVQRRFGITPELVEGAKEGLGVKKLERLLRKAKRALRSMGYSKREAEEELRLATTKLQEQTGEKR
jgi:hypothetical protein